MSPFTEACQLEGLGAFLTDPTDPSPLLIGYPVQHITQSQVLPSILFVKALAQGLLSVLNFCQRMSVLSHMDMCISGSGSGSTAVNPNVILQLRPQDLGVELESL